VELDNLKKQREIALANPESAKIE